MGPWSFVCVQADYMADEADDPTSDRFLEVNLVWLFGWGAVLRVSGRLGVEVPTPLGLEHQ
jgi:hypothetical protein